MSADDDDGGPGEREVAHRLFAAEFEDATLEYSESDEDRAPNYVVTPTGARVNRLFVAGVLTEVETVNENTLRGRVVDPTGAFVTYAGQYQPDEVAFLDRTRPPAFVSLTGKGRTFQPEDSDVVYSSVRPERLSEVDADTRDAWVVDAAEATLRRVAVAAAAREMDARGDTLHDRLVEAGVDESLATGVTLALDHYGTTASYLESLRAVATEALAVVADERDEVSATTAAPDADDGATVGPLPEHVRLGAMDDETTAVTASDETATSAADSEPVTATAETGVTDTGDDGGEPAGTGADEPNSVEAGVDATAVDGETSETTVDSGTDETTVDSGTDETTVDSGTDETTVDAVTAGATDSGGVTGSTGDTGSAGDTDAGGETEMGSTTGTDDLGGFDETGSTDTAVDGDDGGADGLGGFDDASATGSDETLGETGTDDLGGFDEPESADDGPGEFGAADDGPGASGAGDSPDGFDDEGEPPLDEDELDDALTDEEREAVRSEHGVGFSTGTEVPEPEESELDAPDPEEITPTPETETDTASAGGSPPTETGSPDGVGSSVGTEADGVATDAGGDDTAATDPGPDTTADAAETGGDGAVEVDLEAAVVEIMGELDDGDGADREAVMAVAVDRHGADPAAAEEAIQGALMSGQCYEAGGGLKPI